MISTAPTQAGKEWRALAVSVDCGKDQGLAKENNYPTVRVGSATYVNQHLRRLLVFGGGAWKTGPSPSRHHDPVVKTCHAHNERTAIRLRKVVFLVGLRATCVYGALWTGEISSPGCGSKMWSYMALEKKSSLGI